MLSRRKELLLLVLVMLTADCTTPLKSPLGCRLSITQVKVINLVYQYDEHDKIKRLLT